MARAKTEIAEALALIAAGHSDYEVGRRLGIPRGTVMNWRHGKIPADAGCSACLGPRHDLDAIDSSAYCYLLGQYLGDGTVFATGRYGRGLRIATDPGYPGIVEECCGAIEAVRGRRPSLYRDPVKRLLSLTSYWRSWPCLLPQHGPGRKHQRRIVLALWQVAHVEAAPGPFLRGLIHSDGWRGLNRVHVKGRDYTYPRYQFSNRSDDIRTLFTYACELVSVEWRRWGKWHISVAKRGSVALLDEYVGPKA